MSTLNDAMEELVTVPSSVPDDEGDGREAGPELAAAGSVLAALKQRARELRTEQTVVLDIPGYDGYLAGRFRAVSLARIYGKRTDATTPITPDIPIMGDTLGQALDDLYLRETPDSDELHPMFTDTPARFDDDLVEALDLRPTQRTARAVSVALCGHGELGESRLYALYMQYQGWLMAGAENGEANEQVVNGRAVGEYPPR